MGDPGPAVKQPAQIKDRLWLIAYAICACGSFYLGSMYLSNRSPFGETLSYSSMDIIKLVGLGFSALILLITDIRDVIMHRSLTALGRTLVWLGSLVILAGEMVLFSFVLVGIGFIFSTIGCSLNVIALLTNRH